jgi:hypothetical protein
MALRLLSVLVTLVLMAVLATTMRSRLGSTRSQTQDMPTTLLRSAGMIVEQTHQITGTYAGVSAAPGSTLRLVSADASGYCLQLTWLNKTYHLRGPGGQPASGGC